MTQEAKTAAPDARSFLVIACGALAREIVALRSANGWTHLDVQCLPAELHNYPARIPEAVREQIRKARSRYHSIFVAYGDCGTGGRLDAMLAEEGVERIPGAHCYEFYAGQRTFAALAQSEPGTFYVTDFLARHFERLVIQGLGLDRFPELAATYAQTENAELTEMARRAAARLGLAFELHRTCYGELRNSLAAFSAQPALCPS